MSLLDLLPVSPFCLAFPFGTVACSLSAEAKVSGSTCMPSRQTDRSPTMSRGSLSEHSCSVRTTSDSFKSFALRVSLISSVAIPSRMSAFSVWWLQTRKISLLTGVTMTVRACFHLGLCVLLHFSVLFDWPSTATSTYGLGPNQFFLFSFSLAESTVTCNWAFMAHP